MDEKKTFTFHTDALNYEAIEVKGETSHYVSGFATTTDIDIANELVTEKCMKSILGQIQGKSIKIDFDHEVWRDSEGNILNKPKNLIPLGRVMKAELRKAPHGKLGVWIKAKLNSAYPEFNRIWTSVKQGFLDAFSIAFKPIDVVAKSVGDKVVKMLDNVHLLNIALTGVPVNEFAKLDQVVVKALKEFDEVGEMPEDVKVKSEDEAPEETPEAPEEKAEEKAEEKVEDQPEEKKEEEPKEEKAEEPELKSIVNGIQSELAELKSGMKDITEAIAKLRESPMLKSKVDKDPKVEKTGPEIKSVLDLC